MLEVTYREGQGGFVLLQERHPIALGNIDALTAQRMIAEMRLALAVATRPVSPVMPRHAKKKKSHRAPCSNSTSALVPALACGAPKFLYPRLRTSESEQRTFCGDGSAS